MKVITMDTSKCVGCRDCELACAFAKSKTTCENYASLIRANHYLDEHTVIPMTCLHCEEAWCMSVCPAGAIYRDPDTNAVIINQDKCAGCKMCILACPYGNIHFDEQKLVSGKCDLCGGKPRCV
ncbi:MAG: 4Fe-4S dicluster domain-containing protein, partial [Clostridiales bacterium]